MCTAVTRATCSTRNGDVNFYQNASSVLLQQLIVSQQVKKFTTHNSALRNCVMPPMDPILTKLKPITPNYPIWSPPFLHRAVSFLSYIIASFKAGMRWSELSLVGPGTRETNQHQISPQKKNTLCSATWPIQSLDLSEKTSAIKMPGFD
jgi:hypothetical protein